MTRFENEPIGKCERQLLHSLIFLDANTIISIFMIYMGICLSFMNLDILALSIGIFIQSNRLLESNMHGLGGSTRESSKE
jgi:hypothetical protein